MTFSWEPSIILTNFPWADEKPVRRTNVRHPPSGGEGMSPYSFPWAPFPLPPPPPVALSSSSLLASSSITASTPLHCSILVPAYNTCVLCRVFMSRSVPSVSSDSPSFIWGTDSPVSEASLTTVEPRRRRTSAGTTSPSSSTAFFVSFLSPSFPLASFTFRATLRVRLMTSPGSKSYVHTLLHPPNRYTITLRSALPIPLSAPRLRILE